MPKISKRVFYVFVKFLRFLREIKIREICGICVRIDVDAKKEATSRLPLIKMRMIVL